MHLSLGKYNERRKKAILNMSDITENLLNNFEEKYKIKERLYQNGNMTVFLGSRTDQADKKVFVKRIVGHFSEDFQRSLSQKLVKYSDGSLAEKYIIDYEMNRSFVTVIIPIINGQTLKDKIKHHQNGSQKWVEQVLLIIRSVIVSLKFFEENNCFNGKVQSKNIILNEAGNVLLADFMIPMEAQYFIPIKKLDLEEIQYISPEQAGIFRQPVGIESDFYSLGIVLYEALSGSVPFRGKTINDTLNKHVNDTPISLRKSGLDICRPLDELIGRLLLKDPKDRYQTTSGLLHDVDMILSMSCSELDSFAIGQMDLRSSLTNPSFIGRGEEIAKIKKVVHATQSGSSGIFHLSAYSGCGKSSILNEFSLSKEHNQSLVFYGHGMAHSAQKPLRMFDGIVRDLIQSCIASEDFKKNFQEKMDSKFEALLNTFPSFRDVYPIEIKIQGQAEHGEIRSFEAISRMFNSLSSDEKSAIVVFDDCQWSDEMSMNAVSFWKKYDKNHMDEGDRSKPGTLIILSYREEEKFDIAIPQATVGNVILNLFSLDSMIPYLQSMAGQLPEDALKIIYQMSSGNPFFAKVILQGFIESKVLTFDRKNWIFDWNLLGENHANKKAGDILVERISILDKKIINILKAAAMLGKEFTVAGLKALNRHSEEEILITCEEAKKRNLILLVSDKRFAFSHDKVREALLEKLAGHEKKELHLATAEGLLKSIDVDDYEISFHLASAQEYERAFPYAMRAAKSAQARSALHVASLQYEIAKKGIETNKNSEKFEIYMTLGTVYMLLGHYDRSYHEFKQAESCVRDRFDFAVINARLGELEFKRGKIAEASQALQKGLEALGHFIPKNIFAISLFLFHEALIQMLHSLLPYWFVGRKKEDNLDKKKDLLSSWLYGRLTYTYFFQKGALPTLWAHLKQLNISERYPPSKELGQAYSTHAPVMSMIPWYSRAIKYGKKSLEIMRLLKDAWGEGQALHFLGAAYYCASEFQNAKEHFSNAIILLDKAGDRWEVNGATYHLGMCNYRMGNLKEAKNLGFKAYESGVLIGDNFASGASLHIIAKSDFGSLPREMIDQEIKKTSEDKQRNAEVFQAEGIKFLREGLYELAIQSFDKSFDIIRKAGLRTEYVASLPLWKLTALRLRYESIKPYFEHEKIQILKQIKKVIRQSFVFSKPFRNNLPHYYREIAYYMWMKGKKNKARIYFKKSIDFADKLGSHFEKNLSLFAYSYLEIQDGKSEFQSIFIDAKETIAKMSSHHLEVGRSLEGSNEKVVTVSLVDRFEALLDIGRRMASALTEEDVYRGIDSAVVSLLRARDYSIFEWNSKNGEFTLKKKNGNLVSEIKTEAMIKSLVEKKSISSTYRLPDDREYSVLSSPISIQNEMSIVLYISYEHMADFFGEDDVRLADFIVALAGAAFENAQGFEKINKMTKSLEKDIEDKIQAETSLQKSLLEKELVLREVFHRTKNNMQIISSLLSLQIGSNQDPNLKNILRESQNRITSMSLVHEKLYQSKDLVNINFAEYIEDIVNGLKRSYISKADNIKFILEKKETTLSLDFAVPCGLIINEILTNSIKYAFPASGDGEVKIELDSFVDKDDVTKVILSIRDNGVGLPADFTSRQTHSLGIRLIRGLVQTQLQGELEIKNDNGAYFLISFAEKKYSGRI